MDKKRLLFRFFLLSYCVFILISTTPATASASGRGQAKNVLIISIDTLRPDRLSCYSTEYCQTANIDALASRGVVFERAFAHTPTTLASHVNIMLGSTPLQHGIHENTSYGLSEDFLTLAEFLKDKKYSTGAFIGAFPLDSRFGLAQGFDVYDETYPSQSSSKYVYPERNARQVIRSAMEWLEMQNAPWFSFIHLWDPHAPYSPPEPFSKIFKEDPYSGEVSYVDSELRKLFDFLQSKGLTNDTLVILTSDHGESLGEHGESTHGYFAYNSTIWVPLIMVGPGISAARIDEFVSHIDIFPTVCDFLGFEKPSFLQGVSLLPLMDGRKWEKRAIYFESMSAHLSRGWAPLRGYIQENKKFIDSPLMEFYDLEADFHEQNNLVQRMDLSVQRKKMEELVKDLIITSQKVQDLRRQDRETLENLRRLGYISSTAQAKDSYGPEDDLKTLLPLQKKKATAILLLETNRVAEAVKLLNDIVQKRKDFSDAYSDLAHIYESQGLHEDALAILEAGYKNNPGNYGIILNYGILMVKMGLIDQGIGYIQEAIGKIETDPDAWMHLGLAYMVKGEYQMALEYYEKAFALDRTNALLHDYMGFLHFSIYQKTGKIGEDAASLDHFQQAVELDPGLASAYNGLGGAYKAAGKLDKAISAWEKSLEIDKDYGFPLYNLGVAYLEKGDKKRALKHFERYLFLNYRNLSPEERRELEALILKCKN